MKTDFEKAKMVNSDYWRDRLEMANEGYGLDVLINDENWEVRVAVARQGYGLDILINDKDWKVQKAVLDYFKENNLTLAEWCNQNNKEIDLRKLAFSPYAEARIAAIESGYVYKENEIYIAPNCKFKPYGTDSEKDNIVKSNYWVNRLKMAEEGYGLNILVNDEDWHVRRAVANQGYGLDILINDEDWRVREAVAKQGYGLDILINDEDWKVREAVAKQGYGLDILINDKDWKVRAAVANQGYGLDILINDKDWKVQKAVLDYFKENNLTLAEWCNQNNKEIDLRKLAFSPCLEVRFEAVRSGYIYKNDEIYIGLNCKFIPYGTDPKKDKMVKSDDWIDRFEMAKKGYGLDILINDEDWKVRETVAKQGYGLNILINDEDWKVRAAVADQGYGLDILVNDEDWAVRERVAEQGYGLDILVNDEDWAVRHAVEYYLTSHNLTLEQWKSNQDPSELSVSTSKAEEFNPLDINTLKSEMQNLKDQINTLTKENKSLQEALENHISLEKKNDGREL